jgi:Helicase HerA, central domain
VAGLLLRTAPQPALSAGDRDEEGRPTVYFGVRIDAAVNLLEAREFDGLDRTGRLRKALEEQRSFLNGLLDPSLESVLDLRTRVSPGNASPIEVALIGRVWDHDRAAAEARAEAIRRHLLAALPRHVAGSAIDDEEDLAEWLAAPGGGALDGAQITRREVIAAPRRPDAGVGYYFSVVPFNWTETDWTGLYSTLAASPVRAVLSVALLPMTMPSQFTQLLEHMATFYGRLAREDRQTGGLYYGERMLPPDAFAVDAEPVFRDYARRLSGRVFLMRIEVAAAGAGALPPALTESIAAAVSAGDVQRDHLEGDRAASSYAVRAAMTAYERDLARWNLEALDIRPLEGDAEIWRRPDPPPPELALLCMLGDARDAGSFRLPIAVDGTVPGFRVRRGGFGHVEAPSVAGPSLTLGHLPGGEDPVSVPVRSLTRHMLVAGATGSGKTTTVLELLRQLWLDHRVPFMVIEPVNSDADDYRRLLAEPGFEDLELITVGDEGLRPLRFNPFEVPENVLVSEHIANLHACFKAAFGLWEPLPSIYQDAFNLTYLRGGILASERAGGEPREWPTVVEFLQAMREVTAGLGYAGEVKSNIEAASIRRAEQLVAGVAASTFLTNRPNRIAGLLDHPVVIELKSLGSGDEQALTMALLLNAITEHYQAVRGASPELEHLTVIEEAHRLLERSSGGRGQEEAQAKEKAAEAFANTLAENRKYGEGVLIAEQMPTKLVEDAVKNTNLKVLHRLTAEEDRRYLGEAMGFDEAQMRFATRLTTGEGVVYGDEFPEALLVDVRPRLSAPAPVSPEPSAPPPFAACDLCRAQCAHRGAALAMVRDPAIVDDLQEAVGALEDRSRQAEAEEDWAALLGLLRERVGTFPSLPSEEPGRSDAAYCLFLHGLTIRRAHIAPAWPKAAAARLGIAPAGTGAAG